MIVLLSQFICLGQHNGTFFCNIPFEASNSHSQHTRTHQQFRLARVFEILNADKESKLIESYSVTQATLEQIFLRLAGEENDGQFQSP